MALKFEGGVTYKSPTSYGPGLNTAVICFLKDAGSNSKSPWISAELNLIFSPLIILDSILGRCVKYKNKKEGQVS